MDSQNQKKTTPKNQISLVKTDLQKIIDDYRESVKHRSFSGRNPELGKMIKCQVCLSRHRSSIICRQKFAVELKPPKNKEELTIKQVVGAAPFKKKRKNPHHSHKQLELLQRVIETFDDYNGVWPSTETKSREQVAMEVARRDARKQLKKKRQAKKNKKLAMQYESRRINRR